MFETYGKSSSSVSKSSTGPSTIIATLFAVICCYQFINRMSGGEVRDVHGYDADGACVAVPGVGSGHSLCMEAQLFAGWEELPHESPEELEQLLQVSHGSSAFSVDASGSTSKMPVDATAGNLRASTAVASESTASIKPEIVQKKRPSMRGAAKLASSQKDEGVSNKQLHSKSLSELQEKLEARMEASAQRRAEHRALRALSGASHETPKVASPQDSMTQWAHNLDDLTHELQDHMKARRKARDEHASSHATARMAPTPGYRASHMGEVNSNQKTSQLLDEVLSLGQRMCQDPQRHDRPECAQFLRKNLSTPVSVNSVEKSTLRGHAAHKDRHEHAMAHIKLLEKHLDELQKEREHEAEEIEHESTEILKELCADPARNSYPVCARLLATSSASVSVPNNGKSLRAKSPDLHWSAMKDQDNATKPHHSEVTQLVMHRRALLQSHWDGKIPKVACITVLPQGHTTETLMRYFMDNYKLQHYEGARQLIIVYHSADHEAARIAHLHANGDSVLAAAARGGGPFPSATAYRYGAWLAKGADIVARWDFDAWHHPNRLSMQVRALAVAKRQASLLPRMTIFDVNGGNSTVPGSTGPHGSLIGDASWMQKHWMPLLEEEASVLHGLQAQHVVQVDMPELVAYHDDAAVHSAA
jgi:hypothetical protein